MRIDVWIEPGGGDLRLRCRDYDPAALRQIRSIPGRRWHPEARCWSIPVGHTPAMPPLPTDVRPEPADGLPPAGCADSGPHLLA